MTARVDYRRDYTPWHAFVREIDTLVLRLPDGAQRRTRFEQNMRFSDTPDDYLATTLDVRGGVIVQCEGPGPKALAFRDGLHDLLKGGTV